METYSKMLNIFAKQTFVEFLSRIYWVYRENYCDIIVVNMVAVRIGIIGLLQSNVVNPFQNVLYLSYPRADRLGKWRELIPFICILS
jgi:hypothetical protein